MCTITLAHSATLMRLIEQQYRDTEGRIGDPQTTIVQEMDAGLS
jgi:hypothetical protein